MGLSTTSVTNLEQLLDHPPKGRCELVRGELRMMSPAGSEHGWIIMNIAAPLTTFVKEHRLGYVFGAETGFVVHRDPDSVRAPDVAFVRRQRVSGALPRGFFHGPPDVAVEVFSPSDTASSVLEKAEEWLTSGCLEVWLIDPQRRVASQCTAMQGKGSDQTVIHRPVQHLASELFPGFKLSVKQLFEQGS